MLAYPVSSRPRQSQTVRLDGWPVAGLCGLEFGSRKIKAMGNGIDCDRPRTRLGFHRLHDLNLTVNHFLNDRQCSIAAGGKCHNFARIETVAIVSTRQ
jgi:hypothetical protein